MIEETTFKWIMAIAIVAIVVIAIVNGIITAQTFEPQFVGGWSFVDPITGRVIWS